MFVVECPNCQQVNVLHKKLIGLAQDIKIPTGNWEDVNMDFIVWFPRGRSNDEINPFLTR